MPLALVTHRRHRRAEVLLVCLVVAVVVAANYVWLSVNTLPPHWDQANHLISALKYHDITAACLSERRDVVRGAAHCATELAAVDQSVYAPLFPFTAGMMSYVVGRSPEALTMTNVPFMLLLAGATFTLGRRLHSNAAGVLAAVVLFAYPLVFAVSREFMIEMALLAVTALTAALLVASRHFASRPYTLLFGIAVGLALLTKFTFVLFVVGPIFWAVAMLIADVWRRPDREAELQRRAISVAWAAALAIALALVWYWPNRGTFLSTWRFVNALDPVGGSRLSADALLFYARSFVFDQAGPALAVLLLVGLLRLATVRTEYRAFLLVWIVSIYAIATIPTFKAERNNIGILIPTALVSAIGLASLPRYRTAAIAAVVAFSGVQLATFSLPRPMLADRVGTFGWSGADRSYPRHELWPLEQAVDSLGRRPARVAVVSDHPFVNGTTAEFYARAARLPIDVTPCWMVSRTPPLDLTPFDIVLAKSNADWVRPKGDGCFVGPTGAADYQGVVGDLQTSGAFSLDATSTLPDGSSLLVFRRADPQTAKAEAR